jgi:hypothetical protein
MRGQIRTELAETYPAIRGFSAGGGLKSHLRRRERFFLRDHQLFLLEEAALVEDRLIMKEECNAHQ